MSDLAIRAEHVTKQYRIGTSESYKTLRDTLTNGLITPIHLFANILNGRNSNIKNDSNSTIWALKDVSFEVKKGDVIGIIGRNGVGKSTLLKILSQITEPTAGRVEIHGRVGSLLEVGTGFHPELTGRENIYLYAAILGMKKIEINRKFDEIVSFAEIEKFIDAPVKHYSSGMYMRLAFAVAAHLEPEILLVDEVLAVGDAAFQKKCLGKMGDAANQGRTVVFVSHNMAAIENLCSAAMLLDSGRIVYAGEVNSTIRTYLQIVSPNMSSVSLEQQSNRTGNGRIRFTHFHIEDDTGKKIDIARSGQDVLLVFGFVCSEGARPRNVSVGFGIHGTNNERLAVLYTWYTNQDFEAVPPRGEFRCHIPRFPFAPARYFIYPRIEISGEEADFPQGGVGFIDVEAGDFFGTGRMVGDRGRAPFLLAGSWVTASSCDR